jgi:hypothetical protein
MTLVERWAAFSARERYLIAGALLTAIIVVLRYSPVGNLANFSFGGEDDRWVQVRKIENYHKILSRSKAVQVDAAALRERYDRAQQRLISGETPTQIGAELQGRLSSIATEAGMNVLSSQILKEEEVEGSKRVGVRLTLSGEISGVAKLVQAIEGGQKDFVVTHLEINRKLGSTRRPTPANKTAQAEQASQPPLTVSVEVRSFLRQGA